MMKERDDLYNQDPASPRLSATNDEITKATSDLKGRQWTYISLKAQTTGLTAPSCGGRSRELTANPSRRQGIGHHLHMKTPHTTQADYQQFNRQFATSKLGKHSSSRRARHVSKDVKRMALEEAKSFTSDKVTSAIKDRREYGPDPLSICHLKNLGPLANRTPHNTLQ